jgi:drug efflux transport system permease protein
LIVLIMPLALMIVLGYGIRLDVKHVSTCVLDREQSRRSRDLLERFQSSEYFSVVGTVAGYRDLTAAVSSRVCRLALVIPYDFSLRLANGRPVSIQAIVRATDDNTANVVFNYVQSVITGYEAQLRSNFLRQAGVGAQSMASISIDSRTWFNEDLDSSHFIVPGVVVVVMAVIGTFLTALTVAREWERGTMEQLISTPVTPLEITLGKLAPYFAIGLVDTAICALIAVFWFRAPFRGGVALMCLASALFLAVVLLMGYLISTVTKNQNLASQASLLLTFLPAFMLSGFIVPLAQAPWGVRMLSYLIPARYYVVLLRGIYLKGTGVALLWPQLATLSIFGAVLLMVTLAAFRKSLD